MLLFFLLLALLSSAPAAARFPPRCLDGVGPGLSAGALDSSSVLPVAVLEDFSNGGEPLQHAVAQGMLVGLWRANEALNATRGVVLQPCLYDTNTQVSLVVRSAVDALEAGVVATMGPIFIQFALYAAAATYETDMPRLHTVATMPDDGSLDDNNFFTDIPSQESRSRVIAEMANFFGWRSLAIVYLDNEYGASELSSFRAAVTEAGLAVGFTNAFKDGSAIGDSLRLAAKVGARAIYVVSGTQFLPDLVDALESLGLVGDDSEFTFIAALAAVGVVSEDLAARAPNVYVVSPVTTVDSAEFAAFADTYASYPRLDELARAPSGATTLAAQGYRLSLALAAGVDGALAAGTDPRNRTALKAAMFEAEVPASPLGPLTFGDDGSGLVSFSLSVTRADGRVVTLLTRETLGPPGEDSIADELAAAPLVYAAGYSASSPPPDYTVELCAPAGTRNASDSSQCDACPSGRFNSPADGVDECVTCPRGTQLLSTVELLCQPCPAGWSWEPALESTGVLGCVPPARSETNAGMVAGIVLGTTSVVALLGWVLFRHLQHVRGLRLRKEVAEKRAKEESQFVAFVFHEARNPLNGVNSYVRFSHAELGALADAAARGERPSEEELRPVLNDMTSALVSCERVVEVLDNVMELSKLATNTAVARCAPFSVRRVCAQLHSMMRGVNKTIDVRASVSDNVPQLVLGDPGKLKHVLHNLVANAVASTAKGYVELAVSVVERHAHVPTHEEAEDQRKPASGAGARTTWNATASTGQLQRHAAAADEDVVLLFDVRDTGVGMSDNVREHLFERFFSGKDRGTGLGLYIADRFTRLMGSEISVESPWSPDTSGSRFFFEVRFPVATASDAARVRRSIGGGGQGGARASLLPSAKADSAAELVSLAALPEDPSGGTPLPGTPDRAGDDDTRPAGAPFTKQRAPWTAVSSPQLAKDPLVGWRVAIVDDLAMNRKILMRTLLRHAAFRPFGWKATEASTGEELLRMIREGDETFDLIVMDQMMEGAGGVLNGNEVLQTIRAEGLAAVRPGARPVLVMSSGNCSDEDMTLFMSSGADAVWPKPLPAPANMIMKLREVVEDRQADADA